MAVPKLIQICALAHMGNTQRGLARLVKCPHFVTVGIPTQKLICP
jgi:hypothetical protein